MELKQIPSTEESLPRGSQEPAIKWPTRFGFIVLVTFFTSFGFWATFTPLESAAIASGRITVESNRKTIQHLEGGIVKKLYVREGTEVEVGDLLVKIDDTRIQATVDLLQGQIRSLTASKARLIAERDHKKQIDFPKTLLKKQKEPKVKTVLENQEAIFTANKKYAQDNLDILKNRITQLEKEIESIDAQVESAETQLKLIEEEIESVAYLEARKLIAKPRLLALKREAARLKGNKGEHLGMIAQTKQRISETQKQIVGIKSRQQKETLEELSNTEFQLAELLEREKATSDILKHTEIRAPQAGTIVGLIAHTVGGIIAPGAPIMDIVPSQDTLVVEASIDPLDIDVVRQGLSADIQLSAYKQRHTPKLKGIVKHISADSFQNSTNGATYYRVRIAIEPDELKKLGHKIKLYPGMPVQVMIITDKRTPLDYFITPIKESFSMAFREQ